MNFLFQGVNYLTLLDRSLIYFAERSSEQPGHLFTQPVALHESALGRFCCKIADEDGEDRQSRF
jgi:hypothetical protein